MKKKYFILLLITMILSAVNFALADDFYYNGSLQYNQYNGYTVMNLPPPPPMNSVPFYVRDDYDDYYEDYYKCILGYKHKGLVCRYWRKYAEKNGFYQKNVPYSMHSANNNTRQNRKERGNRQVGNYYGQNNNDNNSIQTQKGAIDNNGYQIETPIQQENKNNATKYPEPYTPQR